MLIRHATIDVGSNSVLVLVAERDEGEPWRRVWETAEITSLAEGMSDGGELAPEPMARTAEAVRRFYRGATLHGAERIAAVGTAALRDASNAETFIKMLAGEGIRVRVLPGEEEARLSYLSVAVDPAFTGDSELAVLDIGGRSTEVCAAKRGASVPIGTMGASEMLGPGPCEPDAIFRAGLAVDVRLESLSPAKGRVVTVGATGVNLACWSAGLPAFDPDAAHGREVSREFVAKAVSDLCRMTPEERANVPGLEPDRAMTIHGGALILERAMDRLKTESVRVSARGLRWGLLEEE